MATSQETTRIRASEANLETKIEPTDVTSETSKVIPALRTKKVSVKTMPLFARELHDLIGTAYDGVERSEGGRKSDSGEQ